MYKSKCLDPSKQNLTKAHIFQWINNTLGTNLISKIQSLGNGVVYGLLLNHFYPNSLAKSKIIMMPKNHLDYKANLKNVQQALISANVNRSAGKSPGITFDVKFKQKMFQIFKVSSMTYSDNWQLINKFYKHFAKFESQNSYQSISAQTQNIIKQGDHDKASCTKAGINAFSNKNKQLQSTGSIFNSISIRPQRNVDNFNIEDENMLQMRRRQHPLTQQQNFNSSAAYGQKCGGMSTPMKGMKHYEDNLLNTKGQANKIIDSIKAIVTSDGQSDNIKVKNLKRMLGISGDSDDKNDLGLELLSDCKKKQQVIRID